MVDAQRFPYTIVDSSLGLVDRMPYLPLTLSLNNQSLNAEGLLDTGASVNVLPYELGLQLGLVWEGETEDEMRLFEKFSDSYGYTFYVLQAA